jgi:hypothetical protein
MSHDACVPSLLAAGSSWSTCLLANPVVAADWAGFSHLPAQARPPSCLCLTPQPHMCLPADAFGRCPLFIGGPVTKNLLHVLHGRRDVEGAMEIIEVGCWVCPHMCGCLHTGVCLAPWAWPRSS